MQHISIAQQKKLYRTSSTDPSLFVYLQIFIMQGNNTLTMLIYEAAQSHNNLTNLRCLIIKYPTHKNVSRPIPSRNNTTY